MLVVVIRALSPFAIATKQPTTAPAECKGVLVVVFFRGWGWHTPFVSCPLRNFTLRTDASESTWGDSNN
jgi:hypothetical protein